MVDEIQHSPFIFTSSSFVTEDKPVGQAWFILGRSQAGYAQSLSPLSHAHIWLPPWSFHRWKEWGWPACSALDCPSCRFWRWMQDLSLSSLFGDLPQSHGLSKMAESSFMKTLSALSTLECSPPGPMDLSGKQSLFQSSSPTCSPSTSWTLPCGKRAGRPYWWSLRQRRHQLSHTYLCPLSLKHLSRSAAAPYFPCESFSWLTKSHSVDIAC